MSLPAVKAMVGAKRSAPPAGETLVLQDDFTVASSTPLLSHTADVGAWGVAASANAESNVGLLATNSSGQFYGMVDVGDENQRVDVSALKLGTTRTFGLLLRHSNPSTWGANRTGLMVRATGTALELRKIVAGVETNLSTWTHLQVVPFTLSTISAKVHNGVVTVTVGGVERLAHTLTAGEETTFDGLTFAGYGTHERGHWNATTCVDDIQIYAGLP